MLREKLAQLASVTKFLGYTMIILGILSLFSGIAGIIAGSINIILGFKLIDVSKSSNRLSGEGEISEDNTFDVFHKLTSFFNIQAVLIVINLIFTVFVVLGFLTRR